MVYPGPWRESRVHEELIVVRSSVDGTQSRTLLGEAPTVPSGWNFEIIGGYIAVGGASKTVAGGVSEPPAPDGAISEMAYTAALAAPVASGSGPLLYEQTHTAGQTHSLGEWTQSHSWTLAGALGRAWVTRSSSAGVDIYAVPAGFDTFTADYYVELESGGVSTAIEIVEAKVLPYGAPSGHTLHVRDADLSGGPFLTVNPANMGTIEGAQLHPTADASPVPLDVTQMNFLAEIVQDNNGIPGMPQPYNDPRFPAVAVIYGGTHSDPGFTETKYAHEGGYIALQLKYRWPRWRQVFYEPQTVPYRRTYPRDDALAGGAGRNWPRPKSVQSSNRTGGGYL